MKVLGLILEINPLHNGHKYFIDQAIKQDNYDYVIAVVSTSFCMRGEISVIDKFTKASLLLDNNIDLVMELPVQKTINSSDYFTYSAISILNQMGVTDICFGTEIDSIEPLIFLNGFLTSPTFDLSIKKHLDNGLSYSAASILALKEFNINEELIKQYSLPNNTLALGYIKAIIQINETIRIHNVKRIEANYYDDNTNNTNIASALALRNNLSNNQDITNYIPDYTYDFVKINQANNKIYDLLKYNFITKDINEFKDYALVTEGIENRMKSFINSNTYEDFISTVQTKRYSLSRIKRTIIQILLNNKLVVNNNVNYLRVLGMSANGKKYLSKLDKETKTNLITNIKNIKDNEILNLELEASKLYDLVTNKDTFMNEFKTPIRKE